MFLTVSFIFNIKIVLYVQRYVVAPVHFEVTEYVRNEEDKTEEDNE